MAHSLYPSDKEGLCPSSGDNNRLMMMINTGIYAMFAKVGYQRSEKK
jgi:hypothetical protein